MTPDDAGAVAEQLVQFHLRFAPLFGKEQAQDHAYTYLKGLMCCPERKSIEPIALCTGTGHVLRAAEVHRRRPLAIRRRPGRDPGRLRRRAVPSAAGTPIGTVGVIDWSGFAKKGAKMAGVWRGGSTTAASARRTTARSASS